MQDIRFRSSARNRRTLVLYGPPASGKSTLSTMFGGVDLEDFRIGATEREELILRLAGSTPIIGAADAQVDDRHGPEAGIISVLLLPVRPVYNARRAERDSLHPHKARQPDVYDGFAANQDRFDVVLSDYPPLDIYKMILRNGWVRDRS